MIIKYVLIGFMFLTYLSQPLKIRYHELEFTTSDPVITERCICFNELDTVNRGFVKETYDDVGRCRKLEFYVKSNIYFESTDFPSIIQYSWSDSSFIQILRGSDGQLFSEEYMVRPNKVEYILSNSEVIRIKSYYNNELIGISNCGSIKIEDADFFMMYSGCEIKYNSNYRIKFMP